MTVAGLGGFHFAFWTLIVYCFPILNILMAKGVRQSAKPVEKQAEKVVVVDNRFLFSPESYKIMLAGLIVIIIGFLLMTGGGSNDPNSFKPEEVYSWRRITLAPIVILLGLGIEVYAIMRKPKGFKPVEDKTM